MKGAAKASNSASIPTKPVKALTQSHDDDFDELSDVPSKEFGKDPEKMTSSSKPSASAFNNDGFDELSDAVPINSNSKPFPKLPGT